MNKVLNILIIIFSCVFGVFLCVNLYFEISYPNLYSSEIEKYSKEEGVQKNLIFAIAKTESSFNEKARSSAGAIGVMQIKKETARFICDLSGDQFDEEALFQADYNIKIGIKYFKYLLDKFKNTETALACYNAGEGNVLRWLQDEKYSDDGITLKEIPFSETKNYLKKVKKNFKVYNFLNKS